MLPTLDARLTAAAELVRPGQPVADIGCDHGKLTAVLAASGRYPKVIGADLRPGPLSKARQTLERLDWKVDYVITHCAPTAIQQKINPSFKSDKLTDFLEEIRNHSQFHYWLFGHYHDNRIIDEKYVLLYEQMVRVL